MADYRGTLSKEHEKKHHGEHGLHVRRLHQGYHVTRHHPDGSTTEHVANDLDEVHDHLEDHMRPAEVAMSPNMETAAPQEAEEEEQQAEENENV